MSRLAPRHHSTMKKLKVTSSPFKYISASNLPLGAFVGSGISGSSADGVFCAEAAVVSELVMALALRESDEAFA